MHFGVDLHEAAAWLGDAAAHVANAQFAPAFRLAAGLAEDCRQLEDVATEIERQGRKGQRRRLLGF